MTEYEALKAARYMARKARMENDPILGRPGRPTKFFDDEIEPKALCRNCEYFDGMGLTAEGNPVKEDGDCLNQNSPRFTTTAEQTCDKFFPCSTRWPEADHG